MECTDDVRDAFANENVVATGRSYTAPNVYALRPPAVEPIEEQDEARCTVSSRDIDVCFGMVSALV